MELNVYIVFWRDSTHDENRHRQMDNNSKLSHMALSDRASCVVLLTAYLETECNETHEMSALYLPKMTRLLPNQVTRMKS